MKFLLDYNIQKRDIIEIAVAQKQVYLQKEAKDEDEAAEDD